VLTVTDNYFVNLNFHDRSLKKPQVQNFMKIHLLEAELLHVDRRQTDTTEIIAVFHKFCKCTKKRKQLLETEAVPVPYGGNRLSSLKCTFFCKYEITDSSST